MVGRGLIGGVALALLSCARAGEAPFDAAPDAFDDGLPDLATASWVLEPVGGSGDDGVDPKLAFTGSGRPVVVWQKDDASAIGYAFREGTAWFIRVIDAPANVTGVFAPEIVGGAGDQAHIAFSGTTAATSSDIFYVRADNSSLTTPVNMTGPGQGAADFDTSPAVVADGDEVTIVYTHTANAMGTGPKEVRTLTFTNAGLPTTPVKVVDSAVGCDTPRARGTADGFVHAVLDCNSGAGDQAVYLSDRSGVFVTQTADIGSDTVIAPDIDVSASGDVHIVVQGQVACPEGMCSEPLYSLNLAAGVGVTGGTEDFFSPAIALDAFDRPIFVFFDLPGRELYWTFNEGAGFFRPQQIDPAGGKLVGSGDDDPETGLPWFAFEERDATPSIWVAQLVP